MFVTVDGQRQPAPAPRLSRTAARQPSSGIRIGEHGEAILAELGLSAAAITQLRDSGAIA
jgi:alpha-methylacyl-CoA racemase